jgi:hypothetical protein
LSKLGPGLFLRFAGDLEYDDSISGKSQEKARPQFAQIAGFYSVHLLLFQKKIV